MADLADVIANPQSSRLNHLLDAGRGEEQGLRKTPQLPQKAIKKKFFMLSKFKIFCLKD
jgi:hypothetical protein